VRPALIFHRFMGPPIPEEIEMMRTLDNYHSTRGVTTELVSVLREAAVDMMTQKGLKSTWSCKCNV
jgi:hypothetical protein